MNNLTNGQQSTIEVVGGVNLITERIQIPDFGGYGAGNEVRIICRGANVLKQADGANIPQIIRNNTNTVLNTNVQIHANKTNNTTDVTGIEQDNISSRGNINGYIKDATVGLDIIDTTETQKVNVYVEDCEKGVRENVATTGLNPDENQLQITSRNCGQYGFHKTAGGNVSLWLNSEQDGVHGALIEGGTAHIIGGIIRGADNDAVRFSGGQGTVSNLTATSPGGSGVHVYPSAEQPCHVKNVTVTDPVSDGLKFQGPGGTVSGCNVRKGDAYGIRASGCSIDVKQSVFKENTNGATITSGTDPNIYMDQWSSDISQS